MLRITEVADSPSVVTLRMEGRVVSEWVAVLEEEVLKHLRQAREVRLDFSGVTFIDRRGVEMLRQIPGDRLQITNCSGLVGDLLSRISDRG